MAAFQCPRCGDQRSKRRHSLCNICTFRDDLMDEHERGAHTSVNPSCDLCKPKHNAQLAASSSWRHVERTIMARPLGMGTARLLLAIDRRGFVAASKLGAKGSKAMHWLIRNGHMSIEWHQGTYPYPHISAQSRHKALELLAEGNVSTTRRESPRDALSVPRVAAARTSTSHANCTHERTPKARAKCRAERAAATS